MNSSYDLLIILFAAAIVVGFLSWLARTGMPDRVVIQHDQIIKKSRGRKEMIPLNELLQIKYHYHAVVGYIGIWEFISKDGKTIDVVKDSRGIDNVLACLETSLPNFSMTEFEKKFKQGDVEDTLDVWERG